VIFNRFKLPKFLTISPTGAPGKKEYAWKNLLNGDYVSIGWLSDYNLTDMTIDQVTQLIREQNYSDEASAIKAFENFLSLNMGDVVAVNNVNHGLFGIGEVKSGYKYKKDFHDAGYEDGHCYSHYKKVEWLFTKYVKRTDVLSGEEKSWKPFGTVGELLEEIPPYILRILGKQIEGEEAPEQVIPEFLEKLISDINNLKNDKYHQERAHESLVEDFLVKLGHKKHTDIKYRQGRLDLSIKFNGKPIVLFEVKKDWDLNRYTNPGAVQQAYGYALDYGIRYLVLTNGDYYAIYDRLKGLSIDDNLVGEFKLTNLIEDDLKLINILSRDNLSYQNIEEIFMYLSEMFK
jgi:hypothetical protein